MAVERRYWDSACFIAVLADEQGRAGVCDALLRAADLQALEIVTSAFTITEVLYPKGGTRLSTSVRNRVKSFFRRSGILLVEVDRRLAEDAQEIFWDYGIKPKDCIHVASAIAGGCSILETYDDGLLKWDGMIGTPPLLIRPPEPLGVRTPPVRIDLFPDEQ